MLLYQELGWVIICFWLSFCTLFTAPLPFLHSHVKAIEEIVRCAQLELELEEQFYSIEEEWSEQVRLCHQ